MSKNETSQIKTRTTSSPFFLSLRKLIGFDGIKNRPNSDEASKAARPLPRQWFHKIAGH